MKTITARITMSVQVTDEEYSEIVRESGTPYSDVDVNDRLLDKFEAKGYVNRIWGDSYIPGPWIDYLEGIE